MPGKLSPPLQQSLFACGSLTSSGTSWDSPRPPPQRRIYCHCQCSSPENPKIIIQLSSEVADCYTASVCLFNVWLWVFDQQLFQNAALSWNPFIWRPWFPEATCFNIPQPHQCDSGLPHILHASLVLLTHDLVQRQMNPCVLTFKSLHIYTHISQFNLESLSPYKGNSEFLRQTPKPKSVICCI